MVVVYKINRLSRSLMDFAKPVDVFDANEVTFVSVTQSFQHDDQHGAAHAQHPPVLRAVRARGDRRADFNVRVPSKALKRASLSKIEITLYRMKERPAQRVSGTAPLQTQFEREVRPIAQLQGVPKDLIPERYPRKR